MKSNHILDEYLHQLIKLFQETENKYESHLKAHPILTRMAMDDEVIFEGMRRALLKEKFYTPKIGCGGPDYQINLIDLPEVFLFASFFGPNQEGRTDISYSTMHHHDDYLLSTINAKGQGYRSLLWKQGYDINYETKDVEIELDKFVPHVPLNIEFIDAHSAHAIFFPKKLTMTYALWSTSYPTNKNSKFKTHPLLQKNKTWIKKILNVARVNPKQLGVAQYREDYFVPNNGKIKLLPGQIKPPDDTNMVQNKLHILQQFLKFDDFKFLKEKVYPTFRKDESVSTWLEKYIDKDPIERNYAAYKEFVPDRHVPLEEYQKVYNFSVPSV